MTLLVRDEADIVRTNIDYHLSQGVSHIFATDNLSTDGTTEILRDYERQGVLSYYRENDDTHDQATWVTRMARLAHSQFPSSLVFHVDTDEFWWPLQGTLAAALDQAFGNFEGIGEVPRVNYVGPNLNVTSDSFLERCHFRQTRSVNVLGSPLPGKVCHRACQDIRIDNGSHKATRPNGDNEPLRIDTVEVLHFPNRSIKQFIEKTRRGASAVRNNKTLGGGVCSTWLSMDRALSAGSFETEFRHQFVTLSDIHAQLYSGELVRCEKLSKYLERVQPSSIVNIDPQAIVPQPA
ncbi:MAG: glycosyltransferase family 2 protein [Lysobacterales bacterium]